MLSVDARIALAPETTYRQLIAHDAACRAEAGGHASEGGRVVVKPALVLLVIAVMLPIMALHTITTRLVVTFAAAWSVVVAIQIVLAAALIASAPARAVSFGRAFDLWFAGHLPYNAWMLLLPITTSLAKGHAIDALAVTFAGPVVWSAFIGSAFCRTVLGATSAGARRRTAVHIIVMLAVTLTLAVWAAGGVDAITSYMQRLPGRY